MKVIKTNFSGLYIIQNNKFEDNRGSFLEIFRYKKLRKKFPFIIFSKSKKNVIRGLHIQTKNPQGKYLTVLKGKILDVVVDLRKKSKTFGKIFSIELSEKNSKSIYIPEGFAHGFCSLAKESLLLYNCTNYRSPNFEIGIKYNDPDLNIKWPTNKPIVSKKDNNSITLKEYLRKF